MITKIRRGADVMINRRQSFFHGAYGVVEHKKGKQVYVSFGGPETAEFKINEVVLV